MLTCKHMFSQTRYVFFRSSFFAYIICQDPRIARAYTAQNKKFCALFPCLAQPTCPIPARGGTDTAGRGAFKPPPEDGDRTKLFDREFQFRKSKTEAETKKTPDQKKKKKWSCICMSIVTHSEVREGIMVWGHNVREVSCSPVLRKRVTTCLSCPF